MRKRRTLQELTAAMIAAHEQVAPDTLWRHYKGQRYRVVTLAYFEQDLDVGVVYESMSRRGVVFVCPLSRWLDSVVYEGQTLARFTRLT